MLKVQLTEEDVLAADTLRARVKQQEKVIKVKMHVQAVECVRDLREVRCRFKEGFQKEGSTIFLPRR